MTKRLTAILLMAAMFVALFSIGDTVRADDPSPQFQANIGGRTIDVNQGSIIGQGTIVSGTMASGSDGESAPTTYCQLPRFKLSVQASGYGHAVMGLNVNAQCQLELTRAEWISASTITSRSPNGDAASGANGDNTVKIRGWAKSEWNDFAEIDLASAYGEVWFWVRGTSYIYDPHDADGRCGWFRPSGWRKDSCKTSWGWTPNTKVWVKTVGKFHNVNCNFGAGLCSHTQWGKFTGKGWLRYTAECESDPSNAVPGAHFECQGGQEHLADDQ